jgi:hypothetical protein
LREAWACAGAVGSTKASDAAAMANDSEIFFIMPSENERAHRRWLKCPARWHRMDAGVCMDGRGGY